MPSFRAQVLLGIAEIKSFFHLQIQSLELPNLQNVFLLSKRVKIKR